MVHRFLGKKNSKSRPDWTIGARRVVRQMSSFVKTVTAETAEVKEEALTEENNAQTPNEEMNNNSIAKAEELLSGKTAAKKRVKVEKKEKGLYERDEKQVTLITEDNKMILND